jgi:peptidyl-prolyl cis-trans isomerase C
MTLRTMVRFGWMVPVLGLAACSGNKTSAGTGSAPTASHKDGPVVAHIGDDVLTADEVKQKLGEQSPFLQARYRDLAHKKEFVQNLVRFEVLAQEAYRKGLDKQPEVQSTIKKVLVQELIRQAFDEKNATFSDADLKGYYDAHVDEFVKPERVRAQHLSLAAPAADKAARAKAKAKIAELLTQLKANDLKASEKHPQHASYQPTLFAELAKQFSTDQATNQTGGDLRYLSRDDMAKQYSPGLADAVFALQEPSQLSGVVEDEQGYHLARMTNRQLAVNRPFDDNQVKTTIKGRLFREQMTKQFDAHVEELKKQANVSIDEAVLAAVELPAPVGMPPPNGMPNMVPPPQPPSMAGTKTGPQ